MFRLIYILTDPRGKRWFYVGVSASPSQRLKQHINKPANVRMAKWIKVLKDRGLEPELTLLDMCTKEESMVAESDCIKFIAATRGDRFCMNVNGL
jgi:hypothetical protein